MKTTRNKKEKHNKIDMLARSKLNSIESKMSKALMVNEISHEYFEAVINEEKKIENWKQALEWWIVIEVTLKKLVWLKKAKMKLKWGINKVIKRNEIINNSLK